jgi:hypothetical protein
VPGHRPLTVPGPVIGCWAFDVGCWMFPRFRGRVGVRGNGPYSNLTSQTLAGTAKRYESSGRVGGLPSGPTRSPAANLLHGKASAAWEPAPPINTQLQLGVWRAERRWNRFSGFSFPRARAHSRPNLAAHAPGKERRALEGGRPRRCLAQRSRSGRAGQACPACRRTATPPLPAPRLLGVRLIGRTLLQESGAAASQGSE